MDGYQIRRLLAKEKIKVNDIAGLFEVSHSAVSQVIHGRKKSSRISEAISIFVDRPISDLWPDNPPTHSSPKEAACIIDG
jgi:transcriptional regulator with XRE-family HTH domain